MTSKKHICKLPIRGGSKIDATVVQMSETLANYWHCEYQPTIDKLGRPDSGWNWPHLQKFYAPLVKLLWQAPFFYCIGVGGLEGDFVPVGMLLLAGRYPSLNNHQSDAVFAWFVATAPDKLVADRVGPNIPRGVGQSLMDVALTHSNIVNCAGRMGLHASPKGGDELMEFYRDRVQLHNLSKVAKLPGARRLSGNDGRYFYADENRASEIRQKLQGNR